MLGDHFGPQKVAGKHTLGEQRKIGPENYLPKEHSAISHFLKSRMSSDAKLYILFLFCSINLCMQKDSGKGVDTREPGDLLRIKGQTPILHSLICKVFKACLGGPKAQGTLTEFGQKQLGISCSQSPLFFSHRNWLLFRLAANLAFQNFLCLCS